MKHQDLVAELESWEKDKGINLPRMFDERPDLFREVMARAGEREEARIVLRFLAAARSVVARAAKDAEYRAVFEPKKSATSDKEETSIGCLDE